MTYGHYDEERNAWLCSSVKGSVEDFKQIRGYITKARYGQWGPDDRLMGACISFNYSNSSGSDQTLFLEDPKDIRELLRQFRERAVHDLEDHVINFWERKSKIAAGFSVVTHVVPVDKVKKEKVA